MSRWARKSQARYAKLADIPPRLLSAPGTQDANRILLPTSPSPTRYGNQRVFFAGRWFDSKGEARYYQTCLLRVASGELLGVIPQISIPLPSGKHRMRLDYGLVGLDRRIQLVDFKGYVTDVWRVKRDEVEKAYGITIEIIR